MIFNVFLGFMVFLGVFLVIGSALIGEKFLSAWMFWNLLNIIEWLGTRLKS